MSIKDMDERIISGAALDVMGLELPPTWSMVRRRRRLVVNNHMSAFS